MDTYLKKSKHNKTGYWRVHTQKEYNNRYKVCPPDKKNGRMLRKDEGGGFFDTPIEAAMALKIYCLKNNIKYL